MVISDIFPFTAFIVIPGCTLAIFPLADARDITVLGGEWNYRFMNEAPAKVTIPHSWNAHDAAEGAQGKRDDAKSVNSAVYKRGEATYSQTLKLTPKKNKRYFLRCGGASIVAETVINGTSAGKHEGAFTAFCYEITHLLKAGENTVMLKVDNTHRDHIAPQRGDFSMFGGLYRPVELIETDKVCIDPVFYASPGVFVTTKSLNAAKAVVEVKTLLNAKGNGAEKATVTVAVLDHKGNKVAEVTSLVAIKTDSGAQALTTLNIPKPKLWNGVKHPYLYQIHVSVKTPDGQTDEITQPLGLRTIDIDPKIGFILNGNPMQVRGVCRHQDMHGKGWALTPQDEERDIRLITKMGATGLRTAHYPQSTNIYNLCDKAGLIVWSEVPNVNIVRDKDDFRENNRLQALEMIYQHWNHPGICVWGIYNEIGHQPEHAMRNVNMEAELTKLNEFVKKADPTRITVAASNQPGRKKLNTIPEHIAFTTYPGWYGGGPETMAGNLDGFIKNRPDKGVGVSEYGHGGSVYMHENPAKRPSPTAFWHPEEWQSHAHEINYACIKARPEIWGSFVWNMFDFGSSARYEGETPGINDKGLVTYDRKTCKDAYYFYKANWNPEPMVYITSRRFAERTQKTVPVKVYSNAQTVFLNVNGKKVGSMKTDDQKRAIWEKVELKPGENTITVTATVMGMTVKDSCTWTLKEAPTQGSEKYLAPQIKKYK